LGKVPDTIPFPDDEVEAAKARDRKAYELHGDRAYLNFPEDYRRKKRKKAKEM
jgi:hypothetical protein